MKDSTALEIHNILESHNIAAAVLFHRSLNLDDLIFCHGVVDAEVVTEENTIFDCASLTKPLVTTTLVLQCIEANSFALDTQLGDFPSLFPAPLHEIRIDQLLTHSSGIQAWYPLYCESRDLKGYVESIARLPRKNTDCETVYSCLNFVLLSAVIESATGKRLTDLATNRIFKRLDLKHTSMQLSKDVSNTAPTELGNYHEQHLCREYGQQAPVRTGTIQGEVHDCNAFYCESRTGNAGLFSTATELATMTEQYMASVSQLLSRESIFSLEDYSTPWGPERRTLGWQRSDSPGSSSIPEFGKSYIGHSGFTGTSIWLSPDQGEIFVLLTNRIHPHYVDYNMNQIRREIQSSVYKERHQHDR